MELKFVPKGSDEYSPIVRKIKDFMDHGNDEATNNQQNLFLLERLM